MRRTRDTNRPPSLTIDNLRIPHPPSGRNLELFEACRYVEILVVSNCTRLTSLSLGIMGLEYNESWMIAPQQIHLGQLPDAAVLDSLADFICGDDKDRFPEYRSSSYLTRFFNTIGIDVQHDGSTRKWWTLEVLRSLAPSDVEKVILRLVDLREYKAEKKKLAQAFTVMNNILAMDNLGIALDGVRPILVRAAPITLTSEDLRVDPSPASGEREFLHKQFTDSIDCSALGIDSVIAGILQSRIDEAQACGRNKVPLGTIFLLGSTLEGLLIAVAIKNQTRFASSKVAPKTKDGEMKKIYDWKLTELIEIYYDIGVLGLDVKKFSHVLRDFRNYIHPYHQMSAGFAPDQHTVDICWQVFKATFAQVHAAKI